MVTPLSSHHTHLITPRDSISTYSITHQHILTPSYLPARRLIPSGRPRHAGLIGSHLDDDVYHIPAKLVCGGKIEGGGGGHVKTPNQQRGPNKRAPTLSVRKQSFAVSAGFDRLLEIDNNPPSEVRGSLLGGGGGGKRRKFHEYYKNRIIYETKKAQN